MHLVCSNESSSNDTVIHTLVYAIYYMQGYMAPLLNNKGPAVECMT